MQYEVPMPLSMTHDMSGTPHYAQQNLYVPNGASRIKTETGSERGVSPHTSEQSSRYSSQTPQTSIAYQQIASQLSNGMRYPSPTQIPGGNMPLIQHSYHPNAPTDQAYPQAQMGAVQPPVQADAVSIDGGSRASNPLPKAFACSTCSKGFARRSDLARHERIHSGIRPHVCDHPGCGKQFIQRSALTVHSRVHTGEKPHMCERCGKPFSDSSSLARHRRIHSGKRPYKCPYADCQKTFTRRTTLTRHQNHHTGTIEESEAATAAILASRVSMATQRSRGSDEEEGYSENGKSPMPQHPSRPSSVSPGSAMSGVPNMQRQTSDYYMQAMNNGMAAVPAHLRGEMAPSPRSGSPAQYQMPVNGSAARPPLTSNPSSGYNPPQILEPSAAPHGQQHNGSATNSPHMGQLWAGNLLTTACPRTASSLSTTTPMPMAAMASTLRPRCTTISSALTAQVPWTTTTRCVDRRCGRSTNLRRMLPKPRLTRETLFLPRLLPETNLETLQDLSHKLSESSKRGQATQLACGLYTTHLSFFTAVEFYRQRKLPDYTPKVAFFQTGLDWLAERFRRSDLHRLGFFARLFIICLRQCCPTSGQHQNPNPFPLYGLLTIWILAPRATSPPNTTLPTNTPLAPHWRAGMQSAWPARPQKNCH